MRVFRALLLVGIIALVTLSAVFTESMFRNMSLEGTEASSEETTLQTYELTYAWIYVIAAILIIALLVIVFKLWYL